MVYKNNSELENKINLENKLNSSSFNSSRLLSGCHWSSSSSQNSNVAIFHAHTAYATSSSTPSSAMSSVVMLSQPYLRRALLPLSSIFYLCQSSNHGKDASKMKKKTESNKRREIYLKSKPQWSKRRDIFKTLAIIHPLSLARRTQLLC